MLVVRFTCRVEVVQMDGVERRAVGGCDRELYCISQQAASGHSKALAPHRPVQPLMPRRLSKRISVTKTATI